MLDNSKCQVQTGILGTGRRQNPRASQFKGETDKKVRKHKGDNPLNPRQGTETRLLLLIQGNADPGA